MAVQCLWTRQAELWPFNACGPNLGPCAGAPSPLSSTTHTTPDLLTSVLVLDPLASATDDPYHPRSVYLGPCPGAPSPRPPPTRTTRDLLTSVLVPEPPRLGRRRPVPPQVYLPRSLSRSPLASAAADPYHPRSTYLGPCPGAPSPRPPPTRTTPDLLTSVLVPEPPRLGRCRPVPPQVYSPRSLSRSPLASAAADPYHPRSVYLGPCPGAPSPRPPPTRTTPDLLTSVLVPEPPRLGRRRPVPPQVYLPRSLSRSPLASAAADPYHPRSTYLGPCPGAPSPRPPPTRTTPDLLTSVLVPEPPRLGRRRPVPPQVYSPRSLSRSPLASAAADPYHPRSTYLGPCPGAPSPRPPPTRTTPGLLTSVLVPEPPRLCLRRPVHVGGVDVVGELIELLSRAWAQRMDLIGCFSIFW